MMFFKYTNVSEVIFHDLKDNPATLTPDEAHEVRGRSLADEELKHIKLHHMSGFVVTVSRATRPASGLRFLEPS
jgi:hypothetical protein